MHSRTKRLLTGATLTLLAAACAAGLGASKAAAASQHSIRQRSTRSRPCGYVAHAGRHVRAHEDRSPTRAAAACITIDGDNVTLYLDSHTITGTGTDTASSSTGSAPA